MLSKTDSMKKIINWIYLFLFTACHQPDTPLNFVLQYSGENRPELEKVLRHYSQNPGDSLKLQAAIFLIENMPGHYNPESPILKKYWKKVDTIKSVPYYQKKILQMIPYDYLRFKPQMKYKEDIKHIRADFLIHNIDQAFRQWKSYPWLESIGFDTFKEYLLPYRIANEPLDYWRDSLSPFLPKIQDHLLHFHTKGYSLHDIQQNCYLPIPNFNALIPDHGLKDFKFECTAHSKLDLFVSRIIGIPSTIDFIPHYADRNGCHEWTTAIDPNQKSAYIFQTQIYKAAKIYRRTFSHHPVALPAKEEYIPPLFKDPFKTDVTGLYLHTAAVSLKVPQGTTNTYLAVFNNLQWKPVAWSKAHKGQAIFEELGKDIVYLPVQYRQDAKEYPLAPPFILCKNGKMHPLIPHKDSLIKISLNRKYPNLSIHHNWNEELIGCWFEASDDKDFRKADTIYQIIKPTSSEYQIISTDTIPAKRYWRFVNPYSWARQLAELQFKDIHDRPIQGKIIGMDSLSTIALSDSNPLTVCNVPSWVGMDFGQAVTLSEIRFLGHNDANGIYPGNTYELLYYSFPEGWISLDLQTARDYKLEYEVPANALYWLRNRTTGWEERIFTWENGQVRFW